MSAVSHAPGQRGRGARTKGAAERVSFRLSIDARDWAILEELVQPGEHVQDVIRRLISEVANGH